MKQFKLDKAVKKAWLQALESGQYQKGCGKLAYNNKYCCLGVLAQEIGLLKDHYHVKGMKGYALEADLSKPVLKESINNSITDGFYISDEIIPIAIQQELARLNDESDTFDLVIHFIRKNL